jgi:hypothetical protein
VETFRMPLKKPNETALRLTEENSHAVISVGESGADKTKKVNREDDGKPLYLKRI